MRTQISFPKIKTTLNHGGTLGIGRRKTARPLSPKCSIHLELKTRTPVFRKNLKHYKNELQRLSKRFHIKIYGVSFNFNHVHAVIQIPSREHYVQFIRALTSKIAAIAGCSKLFDTPPFTRLVKWGRDFRNMMNYLTLNDLETDGLHKTKGRILTQIWSADPWT